ncbi:hypothetical protein ACLKA6_019241 [Drosophila palustris]
MSQCPNLNIHHAMRTVTQKLYCVLDTTVLECGAGAVSAFTAASGCPSVRLLLPVASLTALAARDYCATPTF